MAKRKGGAAATITITLGALLLAAACALWVTLFVYRKDGRAQMREALAFLDETLPETHAGTMYAVQNVTMPILSFEGIDYIAILGIEDFDVRLPICGVWDEMNVNFYPCRFMGSVYDNSLVIGGTDGEGQFDFINRIEIGEGVTVTDMTGALFRYTVSDIRHTKSVAREKLQDEESDLTFYARDRVSRDWILVRCKLLY